VLHNIIGNKGVVKAMKRSAYEKMSRELVNIKQYIAQAANPTMEKNTVKYSLLAIASSLALLLETIVVEEAELEPDSATGI